jgi:hypothetical protein
MALPQRLTETFLQAGVPAATLAAIDDLYGHLGPAAVEAVSAIVERRALAPAELRPEDLAEVRAWAGERYLRQHHDGWMRGQSSPGFWRDRAMGGGATGIVMPLGDLERPDTPWAASVANAVRAATGENQPPPRGLLLLSQNAHRGNQPGNFAFDLVPASLQDALSLNAAEGRHHTLPGSIGETSGAALADPPLAIVWETQPNLYKPKAARNRTAGAAYRRHRSWPLATATAALDWLRTRGYRVFTLRGEAMRAAHEVDPARPLGPEIEHLHEATFGRAAAALGLHLAECPGGTVPSELARLAKVNLGEMIEARGLETIVRELCD